MRRLVNSIVLISIGLAVTAACVGLAFLDTSPFNPGEPLYPLQRLSDLGRARLITDSTKLAVYHLNLLERREDDLSHSVGTQFELAALLSLDEALDLAQAAIQDAPKDDQPLLYERIIATAERIYSILSRLSLAPVQDRKTYNLVESKVNLMRLHDYEPKIVHNLEFEKVRNILLLPQVHMEFDPALQGAIAIAGSIVPHSIQFPPGSVGAEHEFFPLLGAHTDLSCEQCHGSGQYAGTSTQCAACHTDVKPANHFAGDCASCHSPSGWRDIHFNHALAGTNDCTSCHIQDKPANHFQGKCSACHSTAAWRPASFNHQVAGATNCQACHANDRPANHFPGQCSACHNTTAWRQAVFNHEAMGAVDCTSCHTEDKPSNHFDGQCSACHNTSDWGQGFFNHEAVGATDCIACHSQNKPSNHFDGQCSTCHNTSDWGQGFFNHEAMGATDCIACHSQNKPANHFDGQCSTCHSTNAWQPAGFDHTGLTDCQSCHTRPANHFAGQCSACHNTDAWQPASFNHEGQTDCQSCHTRPANHYAGQCSACHNTSAWQPASFNHQGQTDCRSCHTPPAGHWNGQCSQCHNTQSWGGVQVSNHTFPISHKGADGVCSRCHVSNGPAWTCYNCHNQAETEKHHAEKDITNIAARCVECHPNGDD